MKHRKLRNGLFGAMAALSLVLGAGGVASATRAAEWNTSAAVEPVSWGEELWTAARNGDQAQLERLLANMPATEDSGVRAAAAQLDEHEAAREAERAKQSVEARDKLDELLKEASPKDSDISKAIVSAVTLFEVTTSSKRAALMEDPIMVRITRLASERARAAEERGDWLMANELYYRLHLLYEEDGRFKKDSDRLTQRLVLIQLYAPDRLWEMRNARRVADGEDPLPPYNNAADDYRIKVQGSTTQILRHVLTQAEQQHVDAVSMRDMLLGGLDAIEVLATTHDLDKAFPDLANRAAVAEFLRTIEAERLRLQSMRSPAILADAMRTLQALQQANADSIHLPQEVLVHEFGNGAAEHLDEFSQIIWPDDVRQFERVTQGNFTGVGIHIQMDEQRNLQVVTPLEGTPAHRAGIRPKDIIRTVDGVPTLGLNINQAVDLITGLPGTEVTLGIERKDPAHGDDSTITENFTLERSQIRVRTVKGWERTGEKESDWNWFVDSNRRIGYVRLIQFTETTTSELRSAITAMKAEGLNAIILDLRFNPGGLLNEAVSVSDLFLRGGPIVSTQDRVGSIGNLRRAGMAAPLADIPVVVLINEGSASASEIVSGAIQDHAREGDVDAIILGHRSYGKGSVQRVWPIPGGTAAMKLTTEYYLLPSGRKIHRRPGKTDWGVLPDLAVEMLPSQITQALEIRQQADVIPQAGDDGATRPDPRRLLNEGTDLQLETALLLLRARTEPASLVQNSSETRPTP